MVDVEGNEGVAGRHIEVTPAVAWGQALGGQGRFAGGNGDGPRVVCRVGRVMPPRVDGFKEVGVAGGVGCGWGCGLRTVLGVRFSAVGAAGEGVGGPQAQPPVWVAGQGRLRQIAGGCKGGIRWLVAGATCARTVLLGHGWFAARARRRACAWCWWCLFVLRRCCG